MEDDHRGSGANARLIVNRWNDEFSNRADARLLTVVRARLLRILPAGRGSGAAPLPILNCGMACQFNSGELAPLEAIDEYIQDALDLIEFANGAVTSPLGRATRRTGASGPVRHDAARRRQRTVGPAVCRAVRAVREGARVQASGDQRWWPLPIRTCAPTTSSGNGTGCASSSADLVDEHFYQPPAWFIENAHRYDGYPRTGPKVFVGEYAAHEPATGAIPMRPSTLRAAVSGGGVHDRARAQRRRRTPVRVCPTARAHRRLAPTVTEGERYDGRGGRDASRGRPVLVLSSAVRSTRHNLDPALVVDEAARHRHVVDARRTVTDARFQRPWRGSGSRCGRRRRGNECPRPGSRGTAGAEVRRRMEQPGRECLQR